MAAAPRGTAVPADGGTPATARAETLWSPPARATRVAAWATSCPHQATQGPCATPRPRPQRGAVVGAQLGSGLPVAELYQRQQRGVPYETSEGLGFGALLRLGRAPMFARTPEDAARRIGRLAVGSVPTDPTLLKRIIEARLPSHEWSEALRVVTVDVESGAARVFTRADGVSLVDAVAASCAVPQASAPVQIEGRRYMDGGMRSTLNLDLAPGSGPVIALAPSTAAIGVWARIDRQRAALGAERRVEVLYRDAASKRAQGSAVMDRSIVPVLASAGREQGRREASRVATALSSAPR